MEPDINLIKEAAGLIKKSRKTTAFTGAGISVESGIPPFRGEDGIWSKYDPIILDINYFQMHPAESWAVIKEIFYDFFGKAKPNKAHEVLARMEKESLLDAVITQNIDNLHQDAGSRKVHEFHGNSRYLTSMTNRKRYHVNEIGFDKMPPRCPETGGLLKPDFIFFGEGIPSDAYMASIQAANSSDVFLIIGTTGEIMPASQIPIIAKQNGAKIIEVNVGKSNYTFSITDIFLQGKATEVMELLEKELFSPG
ncbi:MAG: NAD-dependent deacylase [Bacteroidetes bacterium]|nr:NAD-dependent deacylase [Bacteroidota bacterium]